MTELDPLARIDALMREEGISYSQAAAIVVCEAHLDNFEPAYDQHFGDNTRGVGSARNIDGQGLPGVEAFYKSEKRK